MGGGYWTFANGVAASAGYWMRTILHEIDPSRLSPEDLQRLAMTQQIKAVSTVETNAENDQYIEVEVEKLFESTKAASITLSGIVRVERKVPEGVLVKVSSVAFAHMLDEIGKDWEAALKIPSDKWEEIIAGAYEEAEFDEVILTPRSGDKGRDVIAIKKGIGSIKILSSVKAYKPGHLVDYDDVRALMGVLAAERDASKGMVITTSDFPPRMMKDDLIASFVPYRLELMNGVQLRAWLKELLKK